MVPLGGGCSKLTSVLALQGFDQRYERLDYIDKLRAEEQVRW